MTDKPLNLALYLVLDPDLCSQSVGIVETALAAVQAGAGIVQLRAPTWKKRRMTECARALKSALTPFHVPLIIDDHADVMLAANADGLHVGQQDLTPADARQLIGSNRILGLSLGSLEDCRPRRTRSCGLRRHRTDFRYAIQTGCGRGHWSHRTAIYRCQGAEAFSGHWRHSHQQCCASRRSWR